MKKTKLIEGIAAVLIGLACLLAVLLLDTKLESILCGFAGACLVPDILQIRRYLYWNAPENKERYQAILENEKIELQDELKEKIRDKSGSYAYRISLYLSCISIILFSLLNALDILDTQTTRLMVLYTGTCLILLLIAEWLIRRHIAKKYE